ncbi:MULTISPECIES: hypothetical protein [Aeromonas]|uniref:hypothetical protein n=1 Tax=Aeromonas TaxID=642 RepID=UPI0038DA9017
MVVTIFVNNNNDNDYRYWHFVLDQPTEPCSSSKSFWQPALPICLTDYLLKSGYGVPIENHHSCSPRLRSDEAGTDKTQQRMERPDYA